jgi:superfamily II DNA or RNA helicase
VRALPPSILHARPRLSSAVFGPVAPVSVRVTLPTEEEIRARLGHLATRNGDVCQRDGRVMIRTRSEDGATLRAEVQGARRRPHAVTVTIAWRPRLDIAGRCDCPAGTGCEHVAAVLLEAVRRPPAARAVAPAQAVVPAPPTLPVAWTEFLARLDTGLAPAARRREHLIYLLEPVDTAEGPRILAGTRLLRGTGDAAQLARGPALDALAAQERGVMQPGDRELAVALLGQQTLAGRYSPEGVFLHGPGSARMLAALVASGRCFWRDPASPPLTAGAPRMAHVAWRRDDEGRHRLAIVGAGVDVVLPVVPPWYLDTDTGDAGPVTIDLPSALAETIATAPPVSETDLPLLAAEFARRFPGRGDLLPPGAELRRIDEAPRVRVVLSAAQLARSDRFRNQDAPRIAVIFCDMSFVYGEAALPATSEGAFASLRRDGAAVLVARDRAREDAARREIRRLGMVPAASWAPNYAIEPALLGAYLLPVPDDSGVADLFAGLLPAWRALGWEVELAADWPYGVLELDGEFTIALEDDATQDWFDLSLGAIVDGQRVDLAPALLPMLSQFNDLVMRHGTQGAIERFAETGAVRTIRLADGRRAVLPRARLIPFLVALSEIFGSETPGQGGRMRLARARAAALAALDAAVKPRWFGGERLRRVAERLRGFSTISEAVVPAGFAGDLRSYQRDGLSWLQFLRDYGLNGILADDMGLGKTVQTLAHLLLEKESGRADRPSLVVAPTSLIANWRFESTRFAPALRVAVWHGGARERAALRDCDLVITSYALLARDRKLLAEQEFHVVVLDEAQAIKNPLAHATQAAHALRARHRICLTGTPLENNLGELWSIMHFLNPGLLGERKRFAQDFRTPIEKHGDMARRDALVARVRPFMLRRTKSAVARDLPARTEIVERLQFDTAQRDLYESVRLATYGQLREEIAARGLARSHIAILAALLKLRQVCCDPRLLRLEHGGRDAGSAKLERLMEMLPEMLAEGRRVLVFSQFTSMLALISAALDEVGITYTTLTGETDDRVAPVRRFQSGEVPVFLISLKAGGVGLNLTAADTVILYDPWWNPAAEAQAIDRAHRIGQDKPVFAYRLIALGTVEEKMLELQARKRSLADALLSGSAAASAEITEGDLEALFAPIG